MSVSVVNVSAAASASGSPGVATVSGLSPTPGNTLVALVTQQSAAARTFSAVTNTGASLSLAVLRQASGAVGGAGVYYLADLPAGVTSVTVSVSSSTIAFDVVVLEVSGLGSTPSLVTDTFVDLVGSLSHQSSSAGVTAGANSVAVCAGVLDGQSGVDCSPGAGYTEAPTSLNRWYLMQYQLFPSGCTGEVGAWTDSNIARVGASAIAVFTASGGGGTTGNPWYYYAQQ